MSVQERRRLLEPAAVCLEYPAGDGPWLLPRPLIELAPFAGFAERMQGFSQEMRQEHYVRTFDVTPRTSLYLSVHLFGEESFKRAELMAGLKGAYQRHGHQDDVELPDHLAIVLRRNGCFGAEEWAQLERHCLRPALPLMIRILSEEDNPYALVLDGVLDLVGRSEVVHV